MPNPTLNTSTSEGASPKKKSDLGPRVLTAVVATPILLYAIFIGSPAFFATIIMFAAAISTWEFINITLKGRLEGYGWIRWFGAILSGFLFFAIYWNMAWMIPILCFIILAPLALLLFSYKQQGDVTYAFGSCLSGMIYGTIPISCLALFQQMHTSSYSCWILLALCITWGSDTFAYFGGRAFGKTKLAPHVSPNKTVEGAFSGMFGSIFFAFALNALFSYIGGSKPFETDLLGQDWLHLKIVWTPLTTSQLFLLAIPANVVSQIGDLAESLIKRAHGVKDSGIIIYGHGGILDRIDGVMFATPWIYFCAVFVFDKWPLITH